MKLGFAVLLACGVASAETRKTAAFSSIEVAGAIPVDVKFGPKLSVEVTGDADKLAQVTTRVKSDALVVNTKGKLDRAKLRVRVTMPDLAALRVPGTGAVTVSGLAGKHLDVSVPGTGQITLAGTVDKLVITVGGTVSLMAKDLVADTATLAITGTAQIDLHADKLLDVTVDGGTATVHVRGQPRIKKSINGTAIIN
jgi:putative autotransporter adhesin-like protein